MSNRSITLTDSLYEYMNDVSLREPPLLLALREETSELTQRSMQISPEQGQFMALVARLIGARRCLEVGVFTGYSSLATALALPDDGRIVACDVSEEWTSVARRYWKGRASRTRSSCGLRRPPRRSMRCWRRDRPARSTSRSSTRTRRTTSSITNGRSRCCVPGGLVLIDNTLWSGRVADPEVADADTVALRHFNEVLHRDERVDLSLLPMGDGLTLARNG